MAQVEAYVEGLNDVLRAFKALPKEASTELRKASVRIANQHMAPAWRNAALYNIEPQAWGQAIASSVRVKSDRVPTVNIGYARAALDGGASSIMLRYPTSTGNRRNSFAPFEKTDWIGKVKAYQPGALKEWGQAVDEIVRKWGGM